MEGAIRGNDSLASPSHVTTPTNNNEHNDNEITTLSSLELRDDDRTHQVANNNSNEQLICQLNTTSNEFYTLYPDELWFNGRYSNSRVFSGIYPFASNRTAQMYELHDHHPMNVGPPPPPSSSSGYATATSTIENTTTIEFGGRLISATIVELTPALLSLGEAASFQINSEADAYEDEVAAHMNEEITHEVPLVMEEQMQLVDNGLDVEEIEGNMRTKQYSATTRNSECCICWEEFKDGEMLGILDCAFEHEFHDHCIIAWLMNNNSCPLCRMDGLIIF